MCIRDSGGAEVTESPKGFFCENRACSFVLWKNSRFFTAKKKVLTKYLAAALLKNGRVPLKGLSLIHICKIITYTLDSESGSSLRAAGWNCAGLAGGKCWTGSRKPASALYPAQMKLR